MELINGDEHKVIKECLVIRKVCIGIMNNKDIDYADFEKMIDFVKNYADKHHHGKEEKILFNKMIDEIGKPAEMLVRHGMLVEHDLGRLFIKNLEEALLNVKKGCNDSKVDVIANAVSYTHLLYRHIDKEDNVAYPFAIRSLSSRTLKKINDECHDYEDDVKIRIQSIYIKLLNYLEEKYK